MRLNAERIVSIATLIAAGGVLVTAPRFATAFQMVEPGLQIGPARLDTALVTGPVFGVLYSASAFLGMQTSAMRMRLPANQRGRRWWLPAACAGIQIAVGLAILVPMFASSVLGEPLSLLLPRWGVVAWSTLVAIAADLVPLTAAASAAVLLPRQETSIHEQAHEREENASKQTSTARQQAKAKYVCSICGWVADGANDQQAKKRLAGHMSTHARSKSKQRAPETAE